MNEKVVDDRGAMTPGAGSFVTLGRLLAAW